MARVVLAMSGGVDSSVAAHLLQQDGYEVIGVFMRHGEESVEACATDESPSPLLPLLNDRSHKQGCCTAADAEDARRVANRLEIPFYALNLQADFLRIVDYFVEEYVDGRTPNPCVMCNNWLKFGKLFAYADSVQADFVATGHYARLDLDSAGRPRLRMGVDRRKDQSYVLFGVERRRLPRMLLPVGGFEKPEIRRLAGELGLRVAEKQDSQEICFVAAGQHADLVHARRPGDRRGDIVTTSGEVVGRHEGIERFTVGQRKGLGVAFGEPRYVVAIDPASHRVVVGTREEAGRQQLTARRLNWLVDPPSETFSCAAQIRYNGRPSPARTRLLEDQRIEVLFEEPQFAVAPGQAVVLYDGDRVIGGGWIESTMA